MCILSSSDLIQVRRYTAAISKRTEKALVFGERPKLTGNRELPSPLLDFDLKFVLGDLVIGSAFSVVRPNREAAAVDLV